jgi:hypothetical protein
MHRLPVNYPEPVDQPDHPVVRALRVLWRIFAWIVAFGAVLAVWSLLRK